MNDCIFCRIRDGDLPAKKILETELSMAFLDSNPANAGHTLVIPKRHYTQMHELTDEELADVISCAKKIAVALKTTVSPDGYNLHQSNGAAAGQVVDHVHFHVIPRVLGDFSFTWTHTNVEEKKMQGIQEKLHALLNE